METLRDKVIVVTGAGDGMGKQMAICFAEEGAHVALVGRTEGKLAAALAAMDSPASRTYVCDLRDARDRAKTVERIVEGFGGIDVLINNAGVWHLANPLDELEEEAIDDVMEVNLTGLMKFTRLVLPHLRKRPEAAIINIVSKQALRVTPGRIAYAASKWGLRGFTDALKEDLKD
ncbi:MAG: SDR family oxidoreductase, partial [Patescibacteria group bacterium]